MSPNPTIIRLPKLARNRTTRILLFALAGLVALFGGPLLSSAAPSTYSLWSNTVVPQTPADPEIAALELGTKFTTNQTGQVVGVRFYKSAENTGSHTGSLWGPQGQRLAKVTFTGESAKGWQRADFSAPVTISAGSSYVVSYTTNGRYADDQDYFGPGKARVSGPLTATAGLYQYGSGLPKNEWHASNYYVDVVFAPTGAPSTSTSQPPTTTKTSTTSSTTTSSSTRPPSTTTSTTRPPTTTTSTTRPPTTTTSTTRPPSTSTSTTRPPTSTSSSTTTAPSSGSWPSSTNTGVPAGTALTTYTGACTITVANTVIDAKTINCDVIVKATGVKITRSHINGRIGSTSGGSVSLTDTYINGGNQEEFPAVGQENISLQRVEVVGGQHSVQCYANCSIANSYLHAQTQPADGGHVNAFISNGGNGFTLTHNTLACTVKPTGVGGGCTADASLFGDFGQISNATFDDNLFKANSDGAGYCTQGGYNPGKNYPNGTGIVYKNNVFEPGTNGKCGIWGPVTAFNSSASGNSWTGNVWTTGGVINP